MTNKRTTVEIEGDRIRIEIFLRTPASEEEILELVARAFSRTIQVQVEEFVDGHLRGTGEEEPVGFLQLDEDGAPPPSWHLNRPPPLARVDE